MGSTDINGVGVAQKTQNQCGLNLNIAWRWVPPPVNLMSGQCPFSAIVGTVEHEYCQHELMNVIEEA